MRKVIYSEYVEKVEYKANGVTIEKRTWELEEKGEAKFHQFGLDTSSDGEGSYSTAILELEDGTVKNVPAEHIRFI